MVMKLFLYHTLGCHLCELAEAVVNDVFSELVEPPELTWIDIAEDDVLIEKFGVLIPVVQLAGSEQYLNWPFSREDLREYLAAC